MAPDPKWKRFEKLVAQVQATLAPDARVTHNEEVVGTISGTLRQIDVSVRKKIGQFDLFIAIQCKDTKRPVDIRGIEESIGLFQDVGAHKGAIVSASGFSESAKKRGAKSGLELYTLVDAESHDWRVTVSIPVLCDFGGIKSYQFTFTSSSGPLVIPPIDPSKIVLFDEHKQELGTTMELLIKQWHDLEPPIGPGEIKGIELVEGTTYLQHNDTYYEVIVKANIIVEQKLYFGALPLEKVQGLYDELDEVVITALPFETAELDVVEVEQTWQRIESRESLATKPFFVLTARDVYGDANKQAGA